MVILTSIPVNQPYPELQDSILQSWLDVGFTKIVSFNTVEEIKQLKETYLNRVNKNELAFHALLPSETGVDIFDDKKKVPLIDVILDFAHSLSQYQAIIINADIYLEGKEKIQKLLAIGQEKLCMVSRYNYDNDFDINNCTIEKFGLDMFVFPTHNIVDIKCSNLCIGKPLWDYWIPFNLVLNGEKVISIHDKIAFHKNHPKQWNMGDHKKMQENYKIFDLTRDLSGKVLSQTIRKKIIENLEIISNL
jgi:hypothetical protein